MTYIIKKIVNKEGNACQIMICSIANLFPNNQFLIKTYGLKLEDRVLVMHTKRVYNSKYHWKGYRTNFKKIFYGTLAEFNDFCRKWYQKHVWKKSHDRGVGKSQGGKR